MNTRLSSARDTRAFLSLRFRGPVVINRVAGGGDKEREEGSSRAYANEHRMLSRAGCVHARGDSWPRFGEFAFLANLQFD